MKKKSNSKGLEKKEVCEIFKIEKDGKEKVVESCGTEKEPETKNQKKRQENAFKTIVFVMLGCLALFFAVLLVNNLMNHFKVDGVKFEIDTKSIKGVPLYKTSIPVTYNGKNADYNFYFRTDPRRLKEEVNVSGKIVFRKNVVLDVTTEGLFCDGDWTIGLMNLKNLYSLLEMNLKVKDNSTIYIPNEDYMFITINKGNKTEIVQISENSYDVNIEDCKVLPAFERLMLEAFIQYEEKN